jgi:hypothetical protein
VHQLQVIKEHIHITFVAAVNIKVTTRPDLHLLLVAFDFFGHAYPVRTAARQHRLKLLIEQYPVDISLWLSCCRGRRVVEDVLRSCRYGGRTG